MSVHFNVVHRKVHWRNPKLRSLNSMPAQPVEWPRPSKNQRHWASDFAIDVSFYWNLSYCFRVRMGYDINRFQGDVDEELLCPICSGVLEDPLQVGIQ